MLSCASEDREQKFEEVTVSQDFPELPGFWTSQCKVLILNAAQCEKMFPMSVAVSSQRKAFLNTAIGTARAPSRLILKLPELKDADTLFKPAVSEKHVSLKIISVRPDNPNNFKLPSLTGAVLLLDKKTGCPSCVMDGQFLTGRRTAAGSGAATDFLCKAAPKHLCVFGSGTQGREHIRAMITVRPSIERVSILSRTYKKAVDLATKFACVLSTVKFVAVELYKANAVVSEADIICTATFSTEPLFSGSKVKRGAHINCVGAYRKDMREIDTTTLTRSLVFIDSEKALLCGDLSQPIEAGQFNPREARVLGASMLKGKQSLGNKQLTLFNSVGMSTQDLYAATEIYKRALAAGAGLMVAL
jgi:ornithine cyclodeaminase